LVANRSWKFCALILFLAVLSPPLRAGNVPILYRAGSGGLVLDRGAGADVPGAPAHLEVLALTGDFVLERDRRLVGGEDESVASMKGMASGIYLSRLFVVSGGRRVEANRKFAIVR
jgi:hypothetical protein